jgi:DUF4097 and DUF4098 domain-containing protein YvlB
MMGKAMKIWLIIAIALVVVGAGVFTAALAACGWDFSKLSTVQFETNTYSGTDRITGIRVDTDTADIRFAPSEDGQWKVVCHEAEKMNHNVSVKDGILTIKVVDEREWYDHIGIWIGSETVTIYLPEQEYASLVIRESTGDVEVPKAFRFGTIDINVSTGAVRNYASATGVIKITASTGDIHVEDVSAASMELSVTTGHVTGRGLTCEGKLSVGVSTGDAQLTDVKCENFTSDGSTGDIVLKDVIATGKMSIDRSTGDVKFDACDAAEILVETSTGNVTGSLRSDKIFIARASTGDVDVPATTSGGKCQITTSTGDIRIRID